ncbi:MAG: hypothetical protein JXA95_03095 [Spirochaetales bacterium]|nr:hypothetical protein [Spirochaetales bacterium]
MLYPLETETRIIHSLDGIWRFRFDPRSGRESEGLENKFYQYPLRDTISMPVPSAWNDMFEDQKDREFCGWVWYEKEFTLPVGNYSEKERTNTPNFDFFNYAGLQRHVLICRVPRKRIEDIIVISDYRKDTGMAEYGIALTGERELTVEVLDEEGRAVVSGKGSEGTLEWEGVILWQPRKAYLYTLQVTLREGIVVIDEVPTVGLMVGFGAKLFSGGGGNRPKTWEAMKTAEHHREVIGNMISRDKNHPCVVMWSVGNEPESWTEGAAEYFGPLLDQARESDPQGRPATCVLMQNRSSGRRNCLTNRLSSPNTVPIR